MNLGKIQKKIQLLGQLLKFLMNNLKDNQIFNQLLSLIKYLERNLLEVIIILKDLKLKLLDLVKNEIFFNKILKIIIINNLFNFINL